MSSRSTVESWEARPISGRTATPSRRDVVAGDRGPSRRRAPAASSGSARRSSCRRRWDRAVRRRSRGGSPGRRRAGPSGRRSACRGRWASTTREIVRTVYGHRTAYDCSTLYECQGPTPAAQTMDIPPWATSTETTKLAPPPADAPRDRPCRARARGRRGHRRASRCAESRATLDMGTMTLYSYVRSKSDLIALMADEIAGELLVPGELPGRLARGAAGDRSAHARHDLPPPVDRDRRARAVPLAEHGPPHRAVVRRAGAAGARVRGHGRDPRRPSTPTPPAARSTSSRIASAASRPAVAEAAARAAAPGGRRGRPAACRRGAGEPAISDRGQHFERGLDWLLAGIAADLESRLH